LSIKVSVVVAAYNTGARLNALVESLDRQTLAADEFELIIVDDGSTNDTLAVARELAAVRPNMIVESIPNSGWPGRPRNVGTDRARGDYVFYSDHDDEFGPRALEVMHAAAIANRADIVYGKVIRKGRDTTHWEVWRRNQAHADVLGAVLTSLTVHKLYRRAFLIEHGIRFREGKIRLEDHNFMAQALPRAETITVVADEPCYTWIHRNDGTNTSSTSVSPAKYWSHYGLNLQTWKDVAGPGPLLDAALVASMSQAFSRMRPAAYLARTPEKRAALFDAVHPMVREHIPARLDEQFSVFKRLRVQALRDGDRERFDRLQETRRAVTIRATVTDLSWHEGRLRVTVRGRCIHALSHRVVAVDVAGREWRLPLPADIDAAAADRTLTELDRGRLEVTIRHRASGVEWPVAVQTTRSPTGAELEIVTEAEIPLVVNAFGGPLVAGTWDVLARVQFLGESATLRVPAPGARVLRGVSRGPVRVYAADDGRLSLRVGGASGDGGAADRRFSRAGLARWVRTHPRLRRAAAAVQSARRAGLVGRVKAQLRGHRRR
jgi:poly(ribitol-phosphate) beta-N-acetylglucosaminyltransferase